MNSKKKGNVHSGHRQRMRDKVVKNGAKTLETHELLEMLLYYTHRQGNTNEKAHEMLEEYGSISNLFKSDIVDMQRRCKVNASVAIFFAITAELLRRYDDARWKEGMLLDGTELTGEYAKFLISHEKRERFYLICLDSKSCLLGTELISTGTLSETHVYTRLIIEAVVKHNARSVVLVHNHPGGSLIPSASDIETTSNLVNTLGAIEVIVSDHIIVAGDDYLSFADKKII